MQPHSTWGLRLRTRRRLVLCILWFKGLSEKQPELYKPLTSNEILCLQILKGCKELNQALEKWSAYLKLWSRFLLFFLIYGLAPEPKLHLETFLAVTADCLTLLCSINLPLLCACRVTPYCTRRHFLTSLLGPGVTWKQCLHGAVEGKRAMCLLTARQRTAAQSSASYSPWRSKLWGADEETGKLLHFKSAYPTVGID